MTAAPDSPASRLFSIPSRFPFADALALGLLTETGNDPLALARMVVLLPTRRARRTLKDAFLRQSGGRPLILPRLVPVSDFDDDEAALAGIASNLPPEEADVPPEISALRRRLLLTKLTAAMPPPSASAWTLPQAARLAQELARLLDEVQTADLTFDSLAALVPEEYARHWQITLDFLKIATHYWPEILAEEGCLDPAERRNRILRAQARAWTASPPPYPVVAAGLTGAIPAVATLLISVASLPNARVVLPGLDRLLDEESWNALDDAHPQAAMKNLLDALALPREAVRDWPCSLKTNLPEERERLISEALRPAGATHRWRGMKPIAPEALKTPATSVERIDCPTPQEEALVIALRMRQVLENPGQTCALITPDRSLARRIAAELVRWNIHIDDSAGKPLAITPVGAFLRLIAEAVVDALAPTPLLSVLQHPLASGGLPTPVFRSLVRRLEIDVLRGVRPAPGIDGLWAARHARGDGGDLDAFLARLSDLFAPMLDLAAAAEVEVPVFLDAHLRLAEALAADGETPGPARLWAGEAGEAAAAFAADLTAGADLLGTLAPASYPALFDVLMQGQTVRSDIGLHARLALWGPMESRLQHADVVILAGLNDAVWPARIEADPWMSRPMRGAFGLPMPEKRVGQDAFDFANAFCAPHVVLTRSEKIDGTPTTPSRWLQRLDAVLAASGLSAPAQPAATWLSWAAALDRPERFVPSAPPAPTPPVSARPKKLSVTRIATWMRDPYAIYAQAVLKLLPLEPLDAEPGLADYGTLVHRAFEDFRRRFPAALPDDIVQELLDSGRSAFAKDIARPAVAAFWWPRFERLAAWAARQEAERAGRVAKTWVEIDGALEIDGFTVTAVADRIDALKDGTLALLDYKTGNVPTSATVASGSAPQLPLEALIAQQGGFSAAGIPSGTVSELLFWRLSGTESGGEEISAVARGKTVQALIDEALDGLKTLTATFRRPETPYLASPYPEAVGTPRGGESPYLHLARVKEWSAGGEE